MRKTITALAATLASFAVIAPAYAGNSEGKIQLKAFATTVMPDGKITSVVTDRIGLPAGAQTQASNSVVPTIAAEYFLSPNLSIETICCITPHDVNGSGSLSGAKLVNNAIILPATVTVKYHLVNGSAIKPYIGAGPTRFFIFSEGVGATARTLGATAVNLRDDFGFALQAGTDIKLNESGLGLSIDAKRYFVDTTAVFRAGTTTVLQTRHKLDPWVLSAGLAYRF
jgi:outer membrane protein